MGLLHMFHEGSEIMHNPVWCIHGTQPERVHEHISAATVHVLRGFFYDYEVVLSQGTSTTYADKGTK